MKCKKCGATDLVLLQTGEFTHELEYSIEEEGVIKVHDEKPPITESYEISEHMLICTKCGQVDWDIELV